MHYYSMQAIKIKMSPFLSLRGNHSLLITFGVHYLDFPGTRSSFQQHTKKVFKSHSTSWCSACSSPRMQCCCRTACWKVFPQLAASTTVHYSRQNCYGVTESVVDGALTHSEQQSKTEHASKQGKMCGAFLCNSTLTGLSSTVNLAFFFAVAKPRHTTRSHKFILHILCKKICSLVVSLLPADGRINEANKGFEHGWRPTWHLKVFCDFFSHHL